MTSPVQRQKRDVHAVRFIDDDRVLMPPDGSVWKNTKGAVRQVINVDEANVEYRRPAPAPLDIISVTGGAWAFWVEETNAKRVGP